MALSKDAKAYYEGGARVSIDGIPVRLARKPSPHALALMRGKNPVYEGPRFLETVMALSKDAKAYYEGGARVSIDGIPVRLARKPSPHALALMRGKNPVYEGPRFPQVRYSKTLLDDMLS